jgi:hypothetical protein
VMKVGATSPLSFTLRNSHSGKVASSARPSARSLPTRTSPTR